VGSPERRARAHFDPDTWEEDLARTTPAGRAVAEGARREYARIGIPIAQLRRVAEHGRDHTELLDCAKVYLPSPDGRFGMIFMLKLDADGRPVLTYLAFGVRHHPRGSRSSTVYQLAHQRLHDRPPPR
jgi:hypothetical protein